MSYQAQWLLESDLTFTGRDRAATIQQADTFQNDARPDIAACAVAVLQDDTNITGAFLRMAAAGPGIADKVDNGDGTITQENVTDADLLSLTQANWPTVAALYFNEDGSPKP
jgi:hypothetical protein